MEQQEYKETIPPSLRRLIDEDNDPDDEGEPEDEKEQSHG